MKAVSDESASNSVANAQLAMMEDNFLSVQKDNFCNCQPSLYEFSEDKAGYRLLSQGLT